VNLWVILDVLHLDANNVEARDVAAILWVEDVYERLIWVSRVDAHREVEHRDVAIAVVVADDQTRLHDGTLLGLCK
jgi:hypothetical protein